MARRMFQTAFSNYAVSYATNAELTETRRKRSRKPVSINPLTPLSAKNHHGFLLRRIAELRGRGEDTATLEQRAADIWKQYQELTRSAAT